MAPIITTRASSLEVRIIASRQSNARLLVPQHNEAFPLTNMKLSLTFFALLCPSIFGRRLGQKQLVVPDEDPFAPAYAKVLGPYDGSDWVVAYLYRQRDCIPLNFDIVGQFLDFSPIIPPRPPFLKAWDCPFLMEGVSVHTEPPTNPWTAPAPKQYSLRNNKDMGPIPVLLIPRDDYNNLTGPVTIEALEGIGYPGAAGFHREVLHPPENSNGGGAQVYRATYVGRGQLEDGRSFDYRLSVMFQKDNTVENVGTYRVKVED